MRHGLRSHLTFANVVSVIALFVALGGGAYAVTVAKKNSVVSKSIKNGQVKKADLGKNAVNGAKVADGSLSGADINQATLNVPASGPAGGDLTGTYPNPTIGAGAVDGSKVANGSLGSADVQDNGLTGADISEGTLTEVPSAQIGGFGRFNQAGGCDPTGSAFIDCVVLTVNLPQQSKVLLTGSADGLASGADSLGTCKLVTQSGDVANTLVGYSLHDGDEVPGALVGITGQLGPGSVDFGIDCNQSAGDMKYSARLTAIEIAPD